jgi:hypothetical protein
MRRLILLMTALLVLALVPTTAGARAFPDRIPLPDGFFPEGIAISGNTAYVGSLIDGTIVAQDLRSGATTQFAGPPGSAAIAVGLDVDDRGRLWVAGGGPALDPGLVPAVRAYDTTTGALVYERAVGAGFVNDVIVTEDAAWFTDSFAAQLIRVPIADDGTIGEPQNVPLVGDYVQVPGAFGLNGIEATGNMLVVAQATAPDVPGAALYAVPADSDAPVLAAERIALDGLLVGADGLVLVGRTLHVVTGPDGIVEVKLAGNLGSGKVGPAVPVPGSVTPTTAAKFGAQLYVVDAKFPTSGAPFETYETVAVPR